MASRRILFGVLVVVTILLGASVIYVIYEPTPGLQPALSEKIALNSNDLGIGWTSIVAPEQYGYDASEIRVMNDTYESFAWLIVFDNVSECESWFRNASGIASMQNMTILNLTLGDEATLCYYGPSDGPQIYLMFARDNIGCNIITGNIVPDGYKAKHWWIDTTIWIAELQLDKIDQYLALHPGGAR